MSDEANTPQRSILDFFKTPQKDMMTAKPKGLLGFFCKKENNGAKNAVEINCIGKVIPKCWYYNYVFIFLVPYQLSRRGFWFAL